MIYDVNASWTFAPQAPSSIISESFIVIGLAVFDISAINVSVIIIITRSIIRHN